MSKTSTTAQQSHTVDMGDVLLSPAPADLKSTTSAKDALMTSIMMAIVVLIIMIALVLWMVSSRFIHHYSVSSLFVVFGIALACTRAAQMMKNETDWRFMAVLLVVMAIGSYLINLHNTSHAWTGALVLIFAFIADAGYSAWMQWGGKSKDASGKETPAKELDPTLLYGGLACDVAMIGLLIYGITGDM